MALGGYWQLASESPQTQELVGVIPGDWFVILNKRLTALLALVNGTRPPQPNSAFLIAQALGSVRDERMYSPS